MSNFAVVFSLGTLHLLLSEQKGHWGCITWIVPFFLNAGSHDLLSLMFSHVHLSFTLIFLSFSSTQVVKIRQRIKNMVVLVIEVIYYYYQLFSDICELWDNYLTKFMGINNIFFNVDIRSWNIFWDFIMDISVYKCFSTIFLHISHQYKRLLVFSFVHFLLRINNYLWRQRQIDQWNPNSTSRINGQEPS